MKKKINKTFISRFLFIMSVLIFIIIQKNIYQFRIELKSNTEIGKEILNEKLMENRDNINENQRVINSVWKIQIPSIGLIADISNGTDKETLNKYVGHFIETPIEEGNIALAGHNRGYDVNYFSRLKELREGDEIIYIHNEINRIYEVTKNKIIKDTDIDVLENTEENILTLITCVENEPNYRRCVQAKEKNLNYNY